MLTVTYIKPVDKPASRAGEPGDVRELYDHDARELVEAGFCELASESPPEPVPEVTDNDDSNDEPA